MSFERYHPSKLNMESSDNNHHHNGNGHVHVKYAPIKIIHNDIVSNEERRKYPQLNLRFQLSEESITRQDPTVTIPLSFLQQLIQQAYSNKQLRAINNPSFRVEENRNDAVEELIKQIQIQQKGFYPIDEEKKIQNALIQNQMNFIYSNEEAIQIIDNYFADNTNLKPLFNTWLSQLELKAIQEMLILCHSDPKGQQYQDLFKALFQKLSIEFYQKHAFAYVLRSGQQEKLKYLSQIGEILNKITKPQEYYYFKQR
ncbi:unnamed protein product (macronuclear) [Paramecium tetraurelia]|uniref:Uncharacterized protein n=1 Tax=Paramecium tetraurelia TaxID=5888 RepID=A0C872_PARTE|nr:uncharacterized protein GSPATT00036120001 [Paramecium tetraurelia]CAK66989.1 unnamed protein product [Paramecium tetraurelia]|eukprot:XP_001434386.1 hypothetical protein (macronuclear) [Paramecium tetraurelia strain d4-2]